MRNNSSPAWFAIAALALLDGNLLGQQTAPQTSIADRIPAGFTPLNVDGQRQPPTRAAVEARPLASESQSYASPSPYQLTAAELPLPAPPQHAPLVLAPRSNGGRSATLESARPIAPSVNGTLGTVAGSLGIVLGLLFVVVWFSRRFAPPGTSMLPKEAVELLGRTSLSGRQQAQLMRVGNKLLLVAVSPAGAETLTEITDPTEVEHLLALCRREEPGSASAAFRQVLNQISKEPAVGGFAGTAGTSARGGR